MPTLDPCVYIFFFLLSHNKKGKRKRGNEHTHAHTQEKQGGVLHGKRSGWSRVNIRAKHTNLKVCIYSNNISTPKYTIFKEKYIERGKIIHTQKNHHHHLLFIFFCVCGRLEHTVILNFYFVSKRFFFYIASVAAVFFSSVPTASCR